MWLSYVHFSLNGMKKFVCYSCVAFICALSFEWNEEVCYSSVAPTFSFERNEEICLLVMCGFHMCTFL